MLNLPLKLEHYVSSHVARTNTTGITHKKSWLFHFALEVFPEYKYLLGEKLLKWARNNSIQVNK